jgi:hypothetical protein
MEVTALFFLKGIEEGGKTDESGSLEEWTESREDGRVMLREKEAQRDSEGEYSEEWKGKQRRMEGGY